MLIIAKLVNRSCVIDDFRKVLFKLSEKSIVSRNLYAMHTVPSLVSYFLAPPQCQINLEETKNGL